MIFTITVGYNVYSNQNSEMISTLSFNNIEALASDESDGDKIFYCCVNTGVCAKGPDADTGEEIIIHGKLSKKPC